MVPVRLVPTAVDVIANMIVSALGGHRVNSSSRTRMRPVKIRPAHLGRVAVIYVRQSTMAQVRDHTESTARQYGLAGKAVRLGWPEQLVEVIDADLGLSGSTATGREGFKALVARVCLGEIGAIFGLEVSRLSRSNADFARLLELARLTDTLLVDTEGVYDLSDYNDMLLLGLKGTISAAELHVIVARLQGAKRAAASRGDLRTPTRRWGMSATTTC